MPPKRRREEFEEGDGSSSPTGGGVQSHGSSGNNSALVKKLKSPDFILSLEVQDVARQYMAANSGDFQKARSDLTNMLSRNYEGSPYYTSALCIIDAYVAAKKDTKEFKGTTESIKKQKRDHLEAKKALVEKKMLSTLSELIKEKLDGDKILEYLDGQSSNGRDNFLDEMCNDKKYWRPFLISLAGNSKHRNSKFLNHVVDKLATKGYHFDVIKQAKTSDYYSAFQRVLEEILAGVPNANAAYWRGRLKPYGKVLTVDSHSVLYTDMLLRRLIEHFQCKVGADANDTFVGENARSTAYRFQRVSQEFRRWAAEYHDASENEVNEKQSTMRTIFMNDLCVTNKLSAKEDKEFLSCLEEVLRRYDVVEYGRELLLASKSIASSDKSQKVVNAGDIAYPNYTNPDLMQNILEILRKAPDKHIRVLQDPHFFNILVTDVFHPYHECHGDSHRKLVCEILAVVASNNKGVDLIKQKLIAASMLCNNPDNLIQSYQEANLYERLWDHAENVPTVCMGVLKWIRVALTSEEYWTKVRKTDEEIQNMLNLLEKIGKSEALLAQEVFEIFRDVILFRDVIGDTYIDHRKMQILLQKVVGAILYGDPILVMDFLKLLVQVRPGMRAPKLNVELIPQVVRDITSTVSGPFSDRFALAGYFFFYKRAVLQGCNNRIVDKGRLGNFLKECFKKLDPVKVNQVKEKYGRIVKLS